MRRDKKQWNNIKRAMTFVLPHKYYIVLILSLTLLVAGANAVDPIILKYIFDSLEAGSVLENLIYGTAALLIIVLIRDAAAGISNWLSWRTRLNIHYSLLEKTVEKLHRLPLNYQREEGVGAIITRLDRGIQGFINAVTEIAFNVLPVIAYLIMAIIIMIQLDTRLTFLLLLFVPIPAVIASFAAPIQTKRERNLLDKWAKIYSRFNEVLSGIVTVRSFAMEDHEKFKFLRNVGRANNVVVKGIKFDSSVSALQSFFMGFARIAAIAAGGYLVIENEITLGTLIAFLGYVGGLFGPVQGLTGIYKILKTASVSIEQVFSILDTDDHLGDAPDAVEAHSLKGDIFFENVFFKYGVESRPLLDGITLHASPGEVVAIVGPSGSGKSTLMALLQRFYDPVKGDVYVDGMNIKKLKQISLRRQIGVVLQDALLFNEPVRDNISYGRPGARTEEIEKAAIAANAHDFILRLENGYRTVVGERGSRLSTGERQRIAIARAILKDPPVLILDEATSALDAELEALVQEALENLMKNRTTFIIAHRLATVVNADKIVVLKNGSIIEEGRHMELVKQNGYYSSLVRRQTKGLLYENVT